MEKNTIDKIFYDIFWFIKNWLVPTVSENVATSNEHLVQYVHNATAWVAFMKNPRYQSEHWHQKYMQP